MTADAFALLVAITVPVVTLAALVGLIADVAALERSRDELIERVALAGQGALKGRG